jgi:hypothetical protein
MVMLSVKMRHIKAIGFQCNSTTAPQIVNKAVKPSLDRDKYNEAAMLVYHLIPRINSNGNKVVAWVLEYQKLKMRITWWSQQCY